MMYNTIEMNNKILFLKKYNKNNKIVSKINRIIKEYYMKLIKTIYILIEINLITACYHILSNKNKSKITMSVKNLIIYNKF